MVTQSRLLIESVAEKETLKTMEHHWLMASQTCRKLLLEPHERLRGQRFLQFGSNNQSACACIMAQY